VSGAQFHRVSMRPCSKAKESPLQLAPVAELSLKLGRQLRLHSPRFQASEICVVGRGPTTGLLDLSPVMSSKLKLGRQADCASPVGSEESERRLNETDRQAALLNDQCCPGNRRHNIQAWYLFVGVSRNEFPQSGLSRCDHGLLQAFRYWRCSLGHDALAQEQRRNAARANKIPKQRGTADAKTLLSKQGNHG